MCSARTTKRGFTLVELLIVLGVGSLVLGALGFLYTFTMAQTGDTLAELSATDQATSAARDMERTVRNAMLCEIKTSGGIQALKCTMPAAGVDLDADGVPRSYRPSSLDKFGRGLFAPGTRVWFYLSNATGAFGASGTVLWRAARADDANPTSADGDRNWTFLYGQAASPRFPLVTAFSASVDPTNRLVALSLSAESADYADHKAAASDPDANRRGLTLDRQTFWNNWRAQ